MEFAPCPGELARVLNTIAQGNVFKELNSPFIQSHAPAPLFKIQPHRYSPALGGICWISTASLGVQFFSWGVTSAIWRNKMFFVHVTNLTIIQHLSTGKNERLLLDPAPQAKGPGRDLAYLCLRKQAYRFQYHLWTLQCPVNWPQPWFGNPQRTLTQ